MCHCEWPKTAKQSFPAFRVIASGQRPRSNLFKYFVSLRVVKDHEAIFSDILCHCEWSKTTKQSFQARELLYFPCRKRLLRPPDGVTRNDTKCRKRLLRPSPQAVTRLAMTPDCNDIKGRDPQTAPTGRRNGAGRGSRNRPRSHTRNRTDRRGRTRKPKPTKRH